MVREATNTTIRLTLFTKIVLPVSNAEKNNFVYNYKKFMLQGGI